MRKPPFKRNPYLRDKIKLTDFLLNRGFTVLLFQDDNQSYCGGYGVQHGMYGGRCGICGDPWGDYPRAHEAPGGIYATGIIVKTYKQVKGKLCYLSSPTVKSSKNDYAGNLNYQHHPCNNRP